MKKLFIAALLVASTAISSIASAAVLTLDSKLPTGTLSNNTYQSVFTGLSALTGEYTINSLSFVFSFADNADHWTKDKHVYTETAGKAVRKNGVNYRDVTATHSTLYDTNAESASLLFNNLVLGTGTTKGQSVEHITGTSNFNRTDEECLVFIWLCTQYKSNVTKTTKNVISNTGNFEIKDTISTDSIIAALLKDRQLTLDLKIGGDLMLTGAQLVLNYTQVEKPVEQPGEVPEPSSLLLAGAGLAAFTFARRRRGAATKA